MLSPIPMTTEPSCTSMCIHGRRRVVICEDCDREELDRRIRVSFGTGLHRARSKAGLTQKQLADAVGTSRASIQAMEVGRQNVTVVAVFRLARALGCETLELWPK